MLAATACALQEEVSKRKYLAFVNAGTQLVGTCRALGLFGDGSHYKTNEQIVWILIFTWVHSSVCAQGPQHPRRLDSCSSACHGLGVWIYASAFFRILWFLHLKPLQCLGSQVSNILIKVTWCWFEPRSVYQCSRKVSFSKSRNSELHGGLALTHHQLTHLQVAWLRRCELHLSSRAVPVAATALHPTICSKWSCSLSLFPVSQHNVLK